MNDRLGLGDGWHLRYIRGTDPRGMEQHGPNLPVSIEPSPSANTG